MDSQPTPVPQPSHPQPQQLQHMTPQLAHELVQLFKTPKMQVKYGSINAILQHTKTQIGKLLFLDTQLFKLIIDTMQNVQMHKVCLSTLIHFSSNQACAKKIVSFVQPIVKDLQNSEGLIEELGLLLLLNLSKVEQFTQKLTKKPEQQIDKPPSDNSSPLLYQIFSLMDSKPSRRWVISNIFLNISSHTLGRYYIAKQKLYLQFLKHINDPKQSLRLAVLRILRNIAFLWDNQTIICQLLDKNNQVINLIGIHVLVMIVKSKLVRNWQDTVKFFRQSNYNNILDYDMEVQPDLPSMSTSTQKSINQIQICIDILITLSNADFSIRKPQFMKEQLQKTISFALLTNVTQESKDKLTALETFCFL